MGRLRGRQYLVTHIFFWGGGGGQFLGFLDFFEVELFFYDPFFRKYYQPPGGGGGYSDVEMTQVCL